VVESSSSRVVESSPRAVESSPRADRRRAAASLGEAFGEAFGSEGYRRAALCYRLVLYRLSLYRLSTQRALSRSLAQHLRCLYPPWLSA
jgi:hypothetical protein